MSDRRKGNTQWTTKERAARIRFVRQHYDREHSNGKYAYFLVDGKRVETEEFLKTLAAHFGREFSHSGVLDDLNARGYRANSPRRVTARNGAHHRARPATPKSGVAESRIITSMRASLGVAGLESRIARLENRVEALVKALGGL